MKTDEPISHADARRVAREPFILRRCAAEGAVGNDEIYPLEQRQCAPDQEWIMWLRWTKGRSFPLSSSRSQSVQAALLVLAVSLLISVPLHGGYTSAGIGKRSVSPSHAKLPLRFEANRGQTDERVKFLARGAGYRLFFTPREAVLSLQPMDSKTSTSIDSVVRIRLAKANRRAKITGLDLLPGKSNYLLGSDPAKWQVDVPTYARVLYNAVYPGIDLVYYGRQQQLEYDFVVAPGADPRRIELVFDGVRKPRLDEEGNLVLTTPQGSILQHKPLVYQDIAGVRKTVDSRYVLLTKGHVGFEIGRYDKTRTLNIDPVISYATYLGGSANDFGRAIAVDAAGNAYVTGETSSVNFPGTSASAIQPARAGSLDVFVSKLNPDGRTLAYSTYLGGSGGDVGYAIAVDSNGEAYVTGETDSGGQTPGSVVFPLVSAFQPTYHLGGDAFITKLNAAGNAIVYSSFYGGTGYERGYGIDFDAAGNAYVTGHTNSVVANCTTKCFPVVGAFQADTGGSVDAFFASISPTGSLIYSSFLGGTNSEYSLYGGGIFVDGVGNAYITGTTASTDFPTVNPIQAVNGGGFNDAFVVKVNSAGSALVYSTYLGGGGYDAGHGISVDNSGSASIAGYTDSVNFPTPNAFQATRGGISGTDGFVTRINPSGSALMYSSYLGGSSGDMAFGIAVDGEGNAYVTGWTQSSNFPTVAAVQAAHAGSGDAFVSVIDSTTRNLVFSSYLGGSNGFENGYGIALDDNFDIYVGGDTNSTNFPVTTGSFQTSFGGSGGDAFVARIQSLVSPEGDANGDGEVTVSDVFHLINNLFAGGEQPVGIGDANGDGDVTVADVFYLISFLFAGGPPPI